ncbi:Uncharacterised protein [uncultured Blautia sp.]|uniref:hypothetical protein n=1 Tax=Blautia TaxID=572511 RepID=UPI0008231A4C|nr:MULTISPECIES: hypothetical protein [Blautia]MCU6773986.1 hypothetical protein [Blautia acetigignens]NSL02363.1 hypothetical protein [Blautia glucerasea]SCH23445.1 Uncharacterised protein [uncultured Blautia sp.]
MKKRKITAIILASLMGISAVPATAWAADSYKETEKAAFAKAIQEMGADYAQDLAQIGDGAVKGNAEIKLSLDDGGKAILGMLTPVDISWLEDASMDTKVNLNEGTMIETMDVKVNGTKICTIEYYFDTENSEVYMRIPELNEGYIKMNMEQMTQEAEAEMEEEGMDSSFSTSMDLADAMNSYFSTLDNLPEADALTSILTRYSDIIFDNVTDGENPGTQSSAAGDVSQELTVLEGHVTQAEAQPMFQQILDTAKTDEELKGLIESWTEAMNDPEYSYDTFLQAIEDLEKDLDGEIDESDTSGFVLRAWVDDNGEVVGREVLADDGEQEESLFRYLCTTDGDQRGFSFTMGSDEDSVGLYGSGTLSGDVLSGTYTFTSGGEDAAVIEVADYDTKAVENGIWKGTYTISGAPIEDEDGNSYDPFGGMQLIFTTDGKDENNMEWNLTLAANGVSLGALSITGGNEGEDLEAVDFASLTDVYDFSNDADVEKFGEDVNMDTITANLTSAGMPDGWLESVMEAASGSGAEEITEYDDQTDMAGDTLDDSETPAA